MTHTRKTLQTPLLGEGGGIDEEAMRIALHAAGLDQPLPESAFFVVPFAQITIPREHTLNQQKIREIASSIRTLGRILQPASLGFDPASPTREVGHPDARYRVLCGRHRLKSDQLVAPEQERKGALCIVYKAVFSPALAAAVSSVENFQRGEDWRNEVAEIRELIDARVGMSLSMLGTSLGLKRPLVAQRLTIAQKLIEPLFAQVVSSKSISLAVATRMARLSAGHQQRLAALLEDGTPLTEDMVDEAFLEQLNGSLQTNAPTFLNALALDSALEAGEDITSPKHQNGRDATSGANGEVNVLLEQLIPLVVALQGHTLPGQLTGLTEFFKQELERWQRERTRSVRHEEVEV